VGLLANLDESAFLGRTGLVLATGSRDGVGGLFDGRCIGRGGFGRCSILIETDIPRESA
jgi:hypothetical protein